MYKNLIGIHTSIHYSSLDDFSKKGYYYAMPYVIYAINDNTPQCLHISRPFEMFRMGMHLRDAEHLVRPYGDSTAFLQISGSSFKKMNRYLVRNMERVLADMVSCVIVEIIGGGKHTGAFDNVFFINNTMVSDKLLGRLGSLCLNLECNLISILSYQPASLMTNITNGTAQTLRFDIDFFKREPKRFTSEPYPANIMDSLTQTIFFKAAPESHAPLLPLRFDIFSQGIFNVSKQVDCIQAVLQTTDNLSPPFATSASSELMVRIPKVLHNCIDADETRYKNEMSSCLDEYISTP